MYEQIKWLEAHGFAFHGGGAQYWEKRIGYFILRVYRQDDLREIWIMRSDTPNGHCRSRGGISYMISWGEPQYQYVNLG